MSLFNYLQKLITFVFLVFLFSCKKAKPPIADFLYSGNGSAPSTVQFTNASTNAITYIWDFGDNSFSNEENPSHLYKTAGVYSVKLKATGEGGDNSITKTINIQQPIGPTALFTYSNGGCTAACAVQFTNNSQNAKNYLWDFGDGNSSTEINPNHIYNIGGNYTVTLKALSDNGSNTTTQTINIVQPTNPLSSFSFSGGNCIAPCTVTFTNNSTNATSYQWDFGDGGTSNVKNPTKTYFQSGTYIVTLKAINSNGQFNISSKTVTIANPPQNLTINKITINNFPLTDSNGSNWDFSGGPDIFLVLDKGTNVTANPLYETASFFSDATNSKSYDFNVNWSLNSLNGNYVIGMYDYDTPDPNDFMGGIYFIPNDYSQGKPNSITLQTNKFKFTIYVTWQ